MNRLRRIGLVHTALAVLALAVIAKAAHVQLVQGRAWGKLAERQHFTAREVPAPRGAILDAGGHVLASTRDVVKLEIAPREVRDARALRRALAAAKVDPAWVERAGDTNRAWVVLPGRFIAEEVAAITAMRGVYTTPQADRSYSMSPGLQPLLGRVVEGRGIDGLESTLDSLLRGTSGATQLMRDARGRSFASPTQPGQAPTPGHSVSLTINQELQEIAERTLADAVARLDAEGGDIVIMDPRSGELLAIAGQRNGVAAPSVTAVTEPFEPGSTVKPLIAAGLLARGLARTSDIVPTRGGQYTLHGRTIHDEPHEGPTPPMLSLTDVIRYSSNIGIVQFADRLTPRQEFETLRDFGLGTATGLPYSAEAAGTLRPPAVWSRQSQASLAMGYELAVTPLQLALSYAVMANGGELIEPAVIKEIRSPTGEVVFRHQRRVVRRVLSPELARTMRVLMTGVVDRGTAVDADLATFSLAGKTGTPRRTVKGRYVARQYNPNFVGVFPADAPQLVIVVKLVNPKEDFYGGRTAAPMTKTILQAALAARDAALDRGKLASPMRVAAAPAAKGSPARTTVATTTRSAAPRRAEPDPLAKPVVLDLPSKPSVKRAPKAPRPVPDVRGLPLRDAVRSLHGAGLRVQLARAGPSGETQPPRGSLVDAGSLVRLRLDH
ncbi:MAG: penicillin-binding transpeptidase domain-containing protein [Gemmatimonadota bacterium]